MDLLPRPEPDRKEIIRYLGYRGSSPGPEVLKKIEYCARELEKAAEPRFIYEKFELTGKTGEDGRRKARENGGAIKSHHTEREKTNGRRSCQLGSKARRMTSKAGGSLLKAGGNQPKAGGNRDWAWASEIRA